MPRLYLAARLPSALRRRTRLPCCPPACYPRSYTFTAAVGIVIPPLPRCSVRSSRVRRSRVHPRPGFAPCTSVCRSPEKLMDVPPVVTHRAISGLLALRPISVSHGGATTLRGEASSQAKGPPVRTFCARHVYRVRELFDRRHPAHPADVPAARSAVRRRRLDPHRGDPHPRPTRPHRAARTATRRAGSSTRPALEAEGRTAGREAKGPAR
jgi:hypothetical protein